MPLYKGASEDLPLRFYREMVTEFERKVEDLKGF